MPRIKFEFELQKVARVVLAPNMPPVIIGEVEEYFETPAVPGTETDPPKNAKVKVLINLHPKIKQHHMDMLLENPAMISFTAISKNVSPAVLLPESGA